MYESEWIKSHTNGSDSYTQNEGQGYLRNIMQSIVINYEVNIALHVGHESISQISAITNKVRTTLYEGPFRFGCEMRKTEYDAYRMTKDLRFLHNVMKLKLWI